MVVAIQHGIPDPHIDLAGDLKLGKRESLMQMAEQHGHGEVVVQQIVDNQIHLAFDAVIDLA